MSGVLGFPRARNSASVSKQKLPLFRRTGAHLAACHVVVALTVAAHDGGHLLGCILALCTIFVQELSPVEGGDDLFAGAEV